MRDKGVFPTDHEDNVIGKPSTYLLILKIFEIVLKENFISLTSIVSNKLLHSKDTIQSSGIGLSEFSSFLQPSGDALFL